MIRFLHLLCFLAGLPVYAAAQVPLDKQKYLDSLQHVLSRAGPDSVKARASFLLSDYWSYTDSLRAKKYLEQGRKLSEKYPYLQALAWFYEAGYYFDHDVPSSESAYRKADSLLSRFPMKEAYHFRAKAWRNYGLQQQLKDDNKAFADILLTKTIPLAQKAGDTTYIGSCYQDVGLVFMNLEQYAKAEAYYGKAISHLKTDLANKTALAQTYLLGAKNYIFLEKYPEAKTMLDNALDLLEPYPGSALFLEYYTGEGMYYSRIADYQKALKSFDKGIALAKELDQAYSLQELAFQKYKTLTAQGKYKSAAAILMTILEQREVMSRTGNRKMIYSELSQTYARLGDMAQAHRWLKKYNELSDSLHESKFKRDINELEAKYQNAENQKKIVLLQSEKEKAVLSARNNRLGNWLLGSAFVFSLAVAAFAIFYYRNSKKLAVQKEINYRQQLKEMEQHQQLTFANAMLEGEERERKRVAKDLHDGLGGLLAGVKLNLSSWAAHKAIPQQDSRLAHITGQLDNSIKELRQIARNLMPEALLKFGLEAALRELCESVITGDLRINFEAFNIERSLPLTSQVTIYRIVQEALANALRHAEASDILVQCSQNKGRFYITVEDNGKGMNGSANGRKTGLGLDNIKNRVAYLDGKLEIISAANEGTALNIELNVTG
ncbi:signal transduction histidine kinase [Anseongella ginsenosidimutans]|uniref:histidine kinase n=1 Tax=Anseongella ginsenosidimutans TaxID=496056 RepID=A0A4R3KWS8_9SPHI|nr:sensor histidine kinase [Anseongella ginsenosidimutans]QEC51602.1 sensor histidine kinase [Anseongella ginsenosidimutans]TCS88930.1 signal transduction histidine kinase [Anseongella ginsenosidimutans]